MREQDKYHIKTSNSAIRPDACSHWHHLRLFYFVKAWFALECFALINYLYYIIFYVFYVKEMKKILLSMFALFIDSIYIYIF